MAVYTNGVMLPDCTYCGRKGTGGGGGGLTGIEQSMQLLDVTSYATAFFQNLKAGITSHTNSKILAAPTPPYFSATGKDR